MTPTKLIARIALRLGAAVLLGVLIAAVADWEGSNALALRMGADVVSVIGGGL